MILGQVTWVGCVSLLLLLSIGLQGCCDDPEAQLDWKPDYGEFKKRADWVDEKGIWRGNPTWSFGEELEVEDHHCKTWNGTICVVWTLHEWNCNEHDFGICKCTALADKSDGDYCSEWGCHALEADQEVCRMETNSDSNDNSEKEVCEYSHFPMNENTYQNLLKSQGYGALTTGEWYGYGWVYSGRPSHAWSYPPHSSYDSNYRHRHFGYSNVCIVNGDNKALARWKCNAWREIETEISYCKCKYGAKQSCLDWTCEERDVGLFSVLWRTSEDINPYSEGSELEEYKCTSTDVDGLCTAWEGDIESREEVEWTRCERRGKGSWYCDEYEYPKTLEWHHPEYGNKFLIFLFIEVIFICLFFRTCGDASEDATGVALCCNCLVGIILMPFLIVTFGFYAFLAIGLPFWIIRCLCCVRCAFSSMKGSSDTPFRSNSFMRGTAKIFGRSYDNFS